VGVGIWAILRYGGSYHPIPIVTRPDSYTLPDYPPLDSDPPSTSPDTSPDTATDTSPDTAPDTAPDSSPDTDPPAVTEPPVTTGPSEQQTLPKDEPSGDHYPIYGQMPIYKVERKDPDVINVLLLGTDSLNLQTDRGRTDTMIVVSYHKVSGEVKLVSLLRDGLVPIEGYDWNRLNAAYVFGGVGLAINTVNQLYGMDIQEFVVIDLNGANNFIDYIGGVDVYLTKEEAELYSLYTGKTIAPGMNHLDSNLAMTHMRNRTIGNDFGRTQRQRDTIMAMIQQILTNKTAAEIYDIVDYSFSLIKTNISATDLVGLATSVVGNASKLTVESQNVPYTDAYQFGWYNGMAIISFDIGEAAARINEFIYN